MNISNRIKVSIVQVPEFLEISRSEDGTMKLSGMEGKFLQIILTALGLKYYFVIPEDKDWGSLQSDGHWSGMIGMIVKEQADMAFSFLSVTEDRWKVVKFSTSYIVDGSNLISFKPGNIRPPFAYLYAFDVYTWISLFTVLVIMSVLLAKIQNKTCSMGGTFFNLLANMIRQPLSLLVNSRSCNILVMFWLLYSLIVSYSYSATLLSFLTKPMQGKPIRTVLELSRVVQKGTHQVHVLPFLLPFLLHSHEEHVVQLGQTIKQNQWIINKSKMRTTRYVTDHSSQFMKGTMATLYFGNRDDIFITSETVIVSALALAHSKQFCCASKLNSIISRLSSAGIYQKLLSDGSIRMFLKSCNSFVYSDDTYHSLLLEDLVGVFLLLGIGYSSSFVVLFVEILYSRKHRKMSYFENNM
ncbi:uncharacterized protein NPIL_41361 [Nephila pilipes]|uniref:Ionotropic glutamate receptor L-glutamate and glycine-binding domain-containing protein n=1 Tax=Nephila pilipes TaxID=299642 RepID=A0A8X6UEJ1_NEPPI|nr:uncharacterized protein NPIL_41361 [Nephila pilipes]